MRKLLVATHGKFAEGIKETTNFIVGDSQNISVISAYTTPEFDMKVEAEKYINELNEEDELIVAVDIFGGSVANTFLRYVDKNKIFIISGLNLPMLIELSVGIDSKESTDELIKKATQSAKEGIIYINEVLKENIEREEDDFYD